MTSITKHAIFNNKHFNELRPIDKDLLVRDAVLTHFETHNNHQILDGQGCTVGFEKRYVPFKEYVFRIRIVSDPVISKLGGLKDLKSQTQVINLSVPARNARKHTSRDLRDFCEKYFTDCFDEIVLETKQRLKEEKEAELEKEQAKRENDAKIAAEKAAILAAKNAEQEKIDTMRSILQAAAEEDWE